MKGLKKHGGKKGPRNGALAKFEEFLSGALILTFIAMVFYFLEPQLGSVKLIHILMTLGGQETYDQTVFGVWMIFLMGWTFLVAITSGRKRRK